MYASDAVATTDEGESTLGCCLSHGVADGTASSGELVALEAAGRTVPEDGLSALDSLGELSLALGTYVEAVPAVFDSVAGEGLDLSTGFTLKVAKS